MIYACNIPVRSNVFIKLWSDKLRFSAQKYPSGMQHFFRKALLNLKLRIMKNIALLAAFSFIGLFSFAQNTKVIHDSDAQDRSIQGFHAIRISGGVDLYLSQGNEEKVVVSATNHSLRDRIRTVVENGVLIISMEPGHSWSGINSSPKAYVSVKDLDALKASGGSDVKIDETLKLPLLKLTLSGGCDFKGKVNIDNLTIVQTGGSDIFISGSAARLSIEAAGGSDFHGYDLVSEKCDVSASGGSDVHITVNKELNASANGGSDVNYRAALPSRRTPGRKSGARHPADGCGRS